MLVPGMFPVVTPTSEVRLQLSRKSWERLGQPPAMATIAALLPVAALAQDAPGLDQLAGGLGQNAVLVVVALTALSLAPQLQHLVIQLLSQAMTQWPLAY